MDRRELTRDRRKYSSADGRLHPAGYACSPEIARLVANIDLQLHAAARALNRPSGVYLATSSPSSRAWAWDEWSQAMLLIAQTLPDHPLADAVREVFHQRQRAAFRGQSGGLKQ